ncbi:FAD-dependent monooxygenase [Deinococcus aquaedulcis]|uniref:FAD-dependent monooxygenase n=1 Tax=Deinococcus aquaedulcis TaxID=2840455 RepID=UPI001C82C0D6|nr:FAD-dependent monooxygenase [Deinococcus aquaedulcis]
MKSPRSVLISGAGIAGPAVAYGLRRAGFAPTLVERAPAPRHGGHLIDFWGVGYDAAEQLGLRAALHEDGYAVQGIRFVDRRGRPVVTLPAGALVPAHHRYVNLRRGDLARRLWTLVEPEVEPLFGDHITALVPQGDRVGVTFAHAPPRDFDLVIGADGLHSPLRTLVFREPQDVVRLLGYWTAAFTVPDAQAGEPGTYLSFTSPGRQVARFALRGGHSAYFLLWVQAGRPAPGVGAPAQRCLLEQVFADCGVLGEQMCAALPGAQDLYLDMVAQVRLPRWHSGRVALVGDAAYAPSLLSGQGSALALAGAFVLTHELGQTPDAPGAAFARYQAAFGPFVGAKQRTAVRFGPWFAPRTRLGLHLRGAALRLLALPGVGRALAARSFHDHFALPGQVPAS